MNPPRRTARSKETEVSRPLMRHCLVGGFSFACTREHDDHGFFQNTTPPIKNKFHSLYFFTLSGGENKRVSHADRASGFLLSSLWLYLPSFLCLSDMSGTGVHWTPLQRLCVDRRLHVDQSLHVNQSLYVDQSLYVKQRLCFKQSLHVKPKLAR